jgi:predicted MPP superfamily phosphohydrolase
MNGGRLIVFLSIVLSIWGALHWYVFWRISGIPWVAARVSFRWMAVLGGVLWSSFFVARALNACHWVWLGRPIEFLAANWIGVFFILFCLVFAADVVTVGGYLFSKSAGQIRLVALMAAAGLSALALVQGTRSPVVSEYEVSIKELPSKLNGTTMVVLTDIHLNPLVGESRVARLVEQVNALRPDIVVAVGDIVDDDPNDIQRLGAALKELRAPFGKWAVTGNHEFYAGLEGSVRFLEESGFTVLRDRSEQATPGLVIAGVDDLGARGRFVSGDENAIVKALGNRLPGATVLLCHTPMDAEVAALNGAGLMLCGHTHQGQIWPFSYLVKQRFPLIAGRYDVGGMPVIVSRGAGTWGPRMRLWLPGEIVRIHLRSTSTLK